MYDFITFVNSRFRYDLWIGFEFYNVFCSSHWMENEMFNAFIINTTTKTGNYDQILFMCCGHFWWELQFTVKKKESKNELKINIAAKFEQQEKNRTMKNRKTVYSKIVQLKWNQIEINVISLLVKYWCQVWCSRWHYWFEYTIPFPVKIDKNAA